MTSKAAAATGWDKSLVDHVMPTSRSIFSSANPGQVREVRARAPEEMPLMKFLDSSASLPI